MPDLLSVLEGEPEFIAVRKLSATVAGVFLAPGKSFVSVAAEALELGFDGIAGDLHAGITRLSGSREPWYPRGTEMENDRQLTIVAPDELATIAARMELAEIRPEWIGANLSIDGVPRLSLLPAGTLLFFAGGATLRVEGPNAPCRLAGRAIAEEAGMADRAAGEFGFPKFGQRRRGLVARVDKPGRILPGEAVSVRVPEQWIYRP